MFFYGKKKIAYDLLNSATASVVMDTDSFWQRNTVNGGTTTLYAEVIKRLKPAAWKGVAFPNFDSGLVGGGLLQCIDTSAGSGVGFDSTAQYNGYDLGGGASTLSGLPVTATMGWSRQTRFNGTTLTSDILVGRYFFNGNLDQILPSAGNFLSGNPLTLRAMFKVCPNGMATFQVHAALGSSYSYVGSPATLNTRDATATNGRLMYVDIAIPPTTVATSGLFGLDIIATAGTTPAAGSTIIFCGAQVFLSGSSGLRSAIVGTGGNTCLRSLTVNQTAMDEYLAAHDTTHLFIPLVRNDNTAPRTFAEWIVNLPNLMARDNTPGTRQYILAAPHSQNSNGDSVCKSWRDWLVGLVASRNDCLLISLYDLSGTNADVVANHLDDAVHYNYRGAVEAANYYCTALEQAAAEYATGTVASAAPVVVTINPTIGSAALLTYDFTDPSTGLTADVTSLTWTAIKSDGTVYTPAIGTVAHPATGSYSTSLAFTSGNGYSAGDSGKVTATGVFGGYSWAKVWVYSVGAVGVTVRTITPIVRDINPVQS